VKKELDGKVNEVKGKESQLKSLTEELEEIH
jgi:hypothetical protein